MISHARLEALTDVSHKLRNILQELAELQAACPSVVGVQKFKNRVKRELRFADTLLEHLNKAQPRRELSDTALAKNIQGLDNNFRGLAAELEVAKAAPDLVAISEVFPFGPPGKPKGYLHPSGLKNVEVDVVAQCGNLWIEVKAANSFGTGSTRWMGCSKVSGIQQQARLRLEAARLAHNQRRWQPAKVLFHFPSGIEGDVAEELKRMGVLVSGPGRLDTSLLPEPQAAPQRTNLDVTTLCAMCSEVTNGGLRSKEVQEWAAQTSHWQECLEAERHEPLLPQLLPYLEAGRQLFASEAVVEQFQVLLDQFGGARERQRWRECLPELQIVSKNEARERQSARVVALPEGRSISEAQRGMLSLGDALQACTLTANARAIQAAAAQGVFLEAVTHRAVWLTGL